MTPRPPPHSSDATGRWVCEQHPDQEFPHSNCAGPGELRFPEHEHVYDEQRFCVTCRQTPEEVAHPLRMVLGDAPA